MAIIKNINAEKIQGRLDVTDVSASYLRVTNGIVASTITADIDYSNITNRPTLISSSVQIASDISGSFIKTSGSIAGRLQNIETSSLSFATTGSNLFKGTQTIEGNLRVDGDLTANSFHNIFVSSSIIYSSGSTKFGNTIDDKHQFTGSVEVQGDLKVQYGITANWFHGDVDFTHLVNTPRLLSSSRQIGSEISGSFTSVSSSFANRITNLSTTNVAEGTNLYYTDTRVESKINSKGVISGSSQVNFGGISNKPTLVSGSNQISFFGVSNKPVGLLSSSRQIGSEISGSFTKVSASLASRIAGISTDFNDITNKPTLISSSVQIGAEISGSFTLVSASLADRIASISTSFNDIADKPTLLSSSIQIGSEISGSFNALSGSIASRFEIIEAKDLSFATTGSNILIGDQIISGSLILSRTAPSDLFGSVGDKKGTIAFDDNYLYYCTADSTGAGGGGGTTHVYTAESGIIWNGYHDPGSTYLQLGPSQEEGGTLAPQAGWWFIDDNGNARQLTDGHLWFYPGPGPAPNGTGWLAVVDQDWVYSDSNTTITLYTSNPLASGTEVWKKIPLNITQTPTGSFAIKGSNVFTGDQTVNGNLLINGDITATSFHNLFVSSSTIYTSGSTKFGDTLDDKHMFTGSVDIDGILTVEYGLKAPWFSGSINYNQLANLPRLVSSSRQIESEISGSFTRVSSSFAGRLTSLSTTNVSEGSNLYYTDTRVETKINSKGVVSGSSQINFAGISNKPTLVSGSSQINFFGLTNKPVGLLSSSRQIGFEISGSFTKVSASLASRISNISTEWTAIQNKPVGVVSSSLQLYGSTLQNMVISGSFSGSYKGDGSGLTGVQTTVVQNATAYDTFTGVTSKTITHNFGTKNVIVSVYDDSDALIIPSSITTTDDNTVTLGFAYATTGRAVVAKGGHIVSGSLQDYTHRESISGSTSYTVTHNLNEDYPIVQVYSIEKEQVIPAKVKSTSTNAVLIEFNSSFSGTVVVKK